MSENDITDQPLTGEDDVASADGEAAVGEPDGGGQPTTDIKTVLGKLLNKDFPTDEAALKAVKDTFSYVGKKQQSVVPPELAKKVQELEGIAKSTKDSLFYSEHPELKPYRQIIEAMGNDPDKVSQSEIFKGVVTKLQAHEEMEKSKSVLQSNPRLGVATDKMTQAKEAQQAGKPDEARASATAAVIEAYELR